MMIPEPLRLRLTLFLVSAAWPVTGGVSQTDLLYENERGEY